MATAASEDSSSLSAADHRQVHGVRCVVHNFPDDDDDAESTVRSLLEPDIIVRDCQQSTTGLSDFISLWLYPDTHRPLYLYSLF